MTCAGIAKRKRTYAASDSHRVTGLPDSGEAFLVESEFYKVGLHGFVYRLGVENWLKSTMPLYEVEAGTKGQFSGGIFIPNEVVK